jgi:hypothetical protein
LKKGNVKEEKGGGEKEMNKKIGLLAVVLLSTLVVGVYAVMTVSNHINASWNVTGTGTELTLSWDPSSPNGASFARGQWYGSDAATYGIRLQNTGTATFKVLVKITINAGANLPTDCIKVQCYEDWGSGLQWNSMTFSGWGTSTLTSSYGTPGGFDCTPGWNTATPVRVMFDGDAPITGYNVDMYVEQQ